MNGAFTGLTFRIAEREILFLESAELEFLAGIVDADGDGVRRHGKVP